MRKVRLVFLSFSGFMIASVLVGGLSDEVLASSGKGVVVQRQEGQKQDNNEVVFEVKYSPYYYKWEEPGVKEKGVMQRSELGVSFNFGKFFVRPGIILYGGNVEYAEKIMDGISIDSNTTYNGHGVELKGGYVFSSSGGYKVPVYVALGLEKWKRALDSTSFKDPDIGLIEPVLGYTEKWRGYYGKVGIASSKELGNYYVYKDAYVKVPFGIKNKVEFFNVEVDPKGKLGYGVEIGLGAKHFLKCNSSGEIGFFYEYDKFEKSSIKEGNYLGQPIFLYQPESKRKLIGLKMGIKF